MSEVNTKYELRDNESRNGHIRPSAEHMKVHQRPGRQEFIKMTLKSKA